MRRVVRVLSIAVGLLIASVGLWVATVDVELPRPTGAYAVGRSHDEFTDTGASPERRIAYTLYHPAVEGTGTMGAYMPAAIEDATAKRDMGAFRYLPGAWNRIDHHARDAAEWAVGSFPLIVFSPGGDVQPQYYSSLLSELASHGFVVVALSHPGLTPHIGYPDGSTAQSADPPMPASEEAAIQQHEERIATVARDIVAAFHHLRVETSLAPHLDGRVGAFGHSLGGAGAASAAAVEPAIQAVGDIDGSLGEAARHVAMDRPVFFMQDDGPVGVPDQEARQAFVDGGAPGLKVTLHGATHTTFITDTNFFEETVPFVDDDTLGALEAHQDIARPLVEFFTAAFPR